MIKYECECDNCGQEYVIASNDEEQIPLFCPYCGVAERNSDDYHLDED